MNARQLLHELFDTQVPMRDTRGSEIALDQSFEVDGQRYQLQATGGMGNYTVSFFNRSVPTAWAADVTGTGSSFKVFGTVVNALLAWAQKRQPNLITFQGKGASRVHLYDRLARVLSQKLGMQLEPGGKLSDEHRVYTLVKPGYKPPRAIVLGMD